MSELPKAPQKTSAPAPNRIGLVEADRLLQPGAHINVLRQEAGRAQASERWSRTRALSTLQAHGALVAGPQARKANHGVACTLGGGCWLFFETAHE